MKGWNVVHLVGHRTSPSVLADGVQEGETILLRQKMEGIITVHRVSGEEIGRLPAVVALCFDLEHREVPGFVAYAVPGAPTDPVERKQLARIVEEHQGTAVERFTVHDDIRVAAPLHEYRKEEWHAH